MKKKETRNLGDLYSVGPATVRDLKTLGITAVEQLVGQDARNLYDRLCRLSGKRCDPCMMDVLSAAIAQAHPGDRLRAIDVHAVNVALLTLTALPASAEQFINILTGGTSGVYYPLGIGLSNIWSKALPDAKISVQATKASVENLNLLQQGKGEIAFTLGDSLADAWNGNAEVGFKAKLDKLRTVAAIYPNYIQIVALADSGIKTLADLKGKRVSVGAPASLRTGGSGRNTPVRRIIALRCFRPSVYSSRFSDRNRLRLAIKPSASRTDCRRSSMVVAAFFLACLPLSNGAS